MIVHMGPPSQIIHFIMMFFSSSSRPCRRPDAPLYRRRQIVHQVLAANLDCAVLDFGMIALAEAVPLGTRNHHITTLLISFTPKNPVSSITTSTTDCPVMQSRLNTALGAEKVSHHVPLIVVASAGIEPTSRKR